MPALTARVKNIILSPDSEWVSIERERQSVSRILFGYLVPMALIGPVAGACGMLLRGGGASADRGGVLLLGIQSIFAGVVASLLGAVITACVVYLMTPVYRAPRDFRAALRLVVYAGTPIWVAGFVFVAPLDQVPALIIVLLIALMHTLYVFYLGLHRIVKVPLQEAAECAAIVALASLLLTTVVGYAGGSVGLFPPK